MKKALFCYFFFILQNGYCQWNVFGSFNLNGGSMIDACFSTTDKGAFASSRHAGTPSSGICTSIYSTQNACLNWTLSFNDCLVGAVLVEKFYTIRGKSIIFYTINYSGHIMHYSTDGGLTWMGNYYNIGSSKYICPVENNIFYVLSGSYFLKFNFGSPGVKLDSFPSYDTKFMFFNDTLTGYIVASAQQSTSNHALLKTTQGGVNWSLVYADTTKNFKCIVFPSVSTGYIAGDSGKLIRTTDSGSSWQDIHTGFSNEIKAIDFFNDSMGVVAGDSGFILLTTDRGNTWSLENTGFHTNIQKVYYFNDSVIYAISDNIVYVRLLNNSISVNDMNMDYFNDLVIFPNPNKGILEIGLPENLISEKDVLLYVYDSSGKLVKHEDLKIRGQSVNMNLMNLSGGVYYITLAGRNKTYGGKVVLE